MIIFPAPNHSDPQTGDFLRRFSLRELLRTFVYSQTDDPVPWAPGMYVSLPQGRSTRALTGGFYCAHHHREEGGIGDYLESAREVEPDLLWSFVGTASNHPVRKALFDLDQSRALVVDTQRWSDTVRWAWKTDLRGEGRSMFQEYVSVLGRSYFVVCPRGKGASSIRLFEALQAGRCPVIISDDWLAPPFVDWSSCSLRVPEAEVGELPRILRSHEAEAATLGRQARAVWENYFSPTRQLQTLIDTCRLVEASPPRRAVVASRALLSAQTARRAARRIRDRFR